MNSDWALLETERLMEPCVLQAVSLDRGTVETTEGEVGVFVVRKGSCMGALCFWVVELRFSMEVLWFLIEGLCFWREGMCVSSWPLV